ncbi:heavy-metal-associated domain-containing protein [Flavobacterium limnophilum]|uniref:heavy-metal-associated domain-containing protein n=1 Tax=Flavobacterium limnophilum TaxID=3003262 RepID=UPI0024830F30|nr:heavy metal-associated domain-containing protein [Flavobacterium limnophilum]
MNFSKSILAITLASLLFVGCKEKTGEAATDTATENSTPKVKKEIAATNLQTASFNIKGMTCAIGCAKTIQEELNGLDGVQTASVDFDKELATVSFDKTILTPKKLTKVVEAAADGKTYKVSNMKL